MTKPIISYGDKDFPEIEGRAEQAHLPPTSYLQKTPGTENDFEPVEGRRPSKLLLVNRLRNDVGAWRETYDGASETSKRLLTHWFEEDHQVDDRDFRFYFGQREAIETLIYLVEVKKMFDSKQLVEAFAEVFFPEGTQRTLGGEIRHETTMDGVRQIRRWVPEFEREIVQDLPSENLGRFAFKMATGSGKTVVMAMAMVWAYFHREYEPDSSLSQNFLLIAPNVIVFQRLAKDFANLEIFRTLPLVPPEWQARFNLKVIQRGDGSEPDPVRNLFLTNIHQLYESTTEQSELTNPVEVLLGRKPSKSLSQDRPMLERLSELEDLIVINDEAHHVHDEDKEWNKSLMRLHRDLPQGLDLWLDSSATPKDQNGTYFPWIICDYPLAQAVEDRIVKAPIIVHQVNQEDPGEVKDDNVVDAYAPWITAALSRWREHSKVYAKQGIRPVLFVMAEKNTFADRIGEWLSTNKDLKLKKEEVLVIHTDSKGEITSKKEVEKAREAARDIDDPANRVKVIVSVMMLREGWDVRNVTVVLGLRPFTAKAGILPEQAVGRGLRLMNNLGPDRTQTLEVLGTREFEKFVKQLETEGVGIKTTTKPPKPPMAVEPVLEKKAMDIVIPLTRPVFAREYRRLAELDPMSLDPIYEREELPEQKQIDLRFKFAHLDVEVGQAIVEAGTARLVEEVLAEITNRVIALAGLTASFAELYPAVKGYIGQRCFGKELNIESEEVREALRSFDVRDAIARYLAKQIGTLTATRKEMEFENPKFKLSETKPFYWRRDLPLITSKRTIFNLVATYNGFEHRFATFLDSPKTKDVKRFASLGVTGQEAWTKFRVDYLKPSGATGWYYPDWVVVQSTPQGEVNWIIETKGRVWEGTEAKDAAIQHWCDRVTVLSGKPWKFKRVNQTEFELADPQSFAELVSAVSDTYTLLTGALGDLSALYVVAEQDDVSRLVGTNPQLGPLLMEAHREITDRFGADTKIRLETFVDPEDQDDRQLLLVIEGQSEEATAKLELLDKEWWLAALPRAENKLIITVESV